MPSWFWPVAGVILIVVASANFSKNDNVVLAAQAYIAAFHAGAVMYHQRLGDHPAAGVAPGFFYRCGIPRNSNSHECVGGMFRNSSLHSYRGRFV